MNYLITCAGNGTRFLHQSIKPPKPLIRVLGKELLLWSLESFSYEAGDNLYICYQTVHELEKKLKHKLSLTYPFLRIHWLPIDKLTNGQLETAIMAIDSFGIEGQLVIHNCDTAFNGFEFMQSEKGTNIFGTIPCFIGDGDSWSFVEPLEKGSKKVKQVQEKVRISNLCSVGCYYFSSASMFRNLANEYIAKGGNLVEGEFYIAPVYQHAIDRGLIVEYELTSNVKLFGTPEQTQSTFNISLNSLFSENDWGAHQRGTLIVDIDNTLCVKGKDAEYEECQPIERACAALKRAHLKGIYIILFTARNMRTFNGNLGLINKHTTPILVKWLAKYSIPYDEIYFGKPWGAGGVYYVDDLNLSLDDFMSKYGD